MEVGVVGGMIERRRGRKDTALGLTGTGGGAGKDDCWTIGANDWEVWWESWEEKWSGGSRQAQLGCGKPTDLSPARESAGRLEKADRWWEERGRERGRGASQ